MRYSNQNSSAAFVKAVVAITICFIIFSLVTITVIGSLIVPQIN